MIVLFVRANEGNGRGSGRWGALDLHTFLICPFSCNTSKLIEPTGWDQVRYSIPVNRLDFFPFIVKSVVPLYHSL